MFYFIHILLMYGVISLGNNEKLVEILANTRRLWEPKKPLNAPEIPGPFIKKRMLKNAHRVTSVTMADLQKFYIGYSENQSERRLISLEIRDIDSLSSNEIRFQYTLNSKSHHWNGEGRIDMTQGLVEFNSESAGSGKIYRNNDGKIIFEALGSNSFNYWIIKEK